MRCPAGMSKEARALWDEIQDLLEGNALLENRPILLVYCETYAAWKNAMDSALSSPLIKQGSKAVENPLFETADRLSKKLESLVRIHGSEPDEFYVSLEDDTNLTEKQKRFITEYLRDGNGSRAARRAGYAEKGASQAASEALRNPAIREHITRMRRKIAADVKIDAEAVLRGLHEEATGQGPDTSSSARITAWQHIARHIGFFEADNKQKSKALELLDSLTPQQLASLRKDLRPH